ncbi:MAG: hypothetical protein IPM83_16815 [Ignavibacteria bacterium]|nr:hypothetical protein [Ignavibacteria bacterium]
MCSFVRSRLTQKETPADSRILHPDVVHELDSDVAIQWSEEDIEYARAVIWAARDQRESSTELIDRYSKNWDLERIALLDRVLMRLAIAELTVCTDIPVKVTHHHLM